VLSPMCVINCKMQTYLSYVYNVNCHCSHRKLDNLLHILSCCVTNFEDVSACIPKRFVCAIQDLKANEARLVELNTIAERLTAMGQTEAAEKIRIQIEDLNKRWATLQQVTQERAQTLGSAHEVQRYHR